MLLYFDKKIIKKMQSRECKRPPPPPPPPQKKKNHIKNLTDPKLLDATSVPDMMT